jgi:peptidoglycan hydrolase-like protein with peptidoglycan-binding domain
MRLWRYGIAAGLLAGLGACSNMMGGGSQAPRSAAMAQPTVAPDMVKQVQSKLHDDGYYRQGPVDGVWGSGTEAAVRSFQHDHNLGSSGQLDVPTLEALNIAGRPAGTNNPAPAQLLSNNANPPPPATQPASPNSNPPAADNTAPSSAH